MSRAVYNYPQCILESGVYTVLCGAARLSLPSAYGNNYGLTRNTEPKCRCRVAIPNCKHPLRVGGWVDTLHETAGCVFVEYQTVGRYSVLLGLGRYGDRISVGSRYSLPVQTGPEVHPAYCAMDTGSFPGVKRPGRGLHHAPPSSAKGKEIITSRSRGLFSRYSKWPYTFRTALIICYRK